MSRETIEWLNENTMVGGCAERALHSTNNWLIAGTNGKLAPWWQAEGYKFAYDGFIPQEDVETHLFNWEPLESVVRNQVAVQAGQVADGTDGHGNEYRILIDPIRKGIVHPRTGHCFGYFGKDSYQVHSPRRWLIENVYTILDASNGEAGILTAGQLRSGGVQYVTICAPEGVNVGGFTIHPMLVAGGSCDGSLATTYKGSDWAPLCDNSLNAVMQGAASKLKVKHTSKSLANLRNARDILGVVFEHGTKLEQFLATMQNVDVTDSEFARIMVQLVPDVERVTDKAGKVTNQRALTMMDNKRGELLQLWKADPRVQKWSGTLFGAFQAANTWQQHFRSNNDNGVERGMTGVLNGSFAKADTEFWDIVASIETINTKPLALVLAS